MENFKSAVKKKEFTLVAICALTYFASYFTRKSFAAVMVAMINDGIIDKPMGGYIGMGLFIFYGAGQLISGYLGDKISPKVMIIIGLLISAVCNLSISLITVNFILVAAWAINGFAQAMLWPPIVKILSENLNNEAFVKANLYVTAAAHISTIMLYLYVPLCLKFMEWRVVFYTAAALAFAVGVVLVFGVKNAVNEGLRDTVSISDADTPKLPFVKVIFGAGIIPIFMAIIPMGFLRDGIETWLPTLYSEAFGRDSSESVLLAVLMPVFAIAMVYITTALHKCTLFKNEILGSLITFGISAVTAFVMSGFIGSETVGGRIVCLLLAVIVSGLMHGCNFLLISCLPGRFARYHRAATTSGVCNACVYIGAAVSMYGIPTVESAFSWRGVVISWVIVAAVGGCAALIALKKYSSFIKAEF